MTSLGQEKETSGELSELIRINLMLPADRSEVLRMAPQGVETSREGVRKWVESSLKRMGNLALTLGPRVDAENFFGIHRPGDPPPEKALLCIYSKDKFKLAAFPVQIGQVLFKPPTSQKVDVLVCRYGSLEWLTESVRKKEIKLLPIKEKTITRVLIRKTNRSKFELRDQCTENQNKTNIENDLVKISTSGDAKRKTGFENIQIQDNKAKAIRLVRESKTPIDCGKNGLKTRSDISLNTSKELSKGSSRMWKDNWMKIKEKCRDKMNWGVLKRRNSEACFFRMPPVVRQVNACWKRYGVTPDGWHWAEAESCKTRRKEDGTSEMVKKKKTFRQRQVEGGNNQTEETVVTTERFVDSLVERSDDSSDALTTTSTTFRDSNSSWASTSDDCPFKSETVGICQCRLEKMGYFHWLEPKSNNNVSSDSQRGPMIHFDSGNSEFPTSAVWIPRPVRSVIPPYVVPDNSSDLLRVLSTQGNFRSQSR